MKGTAMLNAENFNGPTMALIWEALHYTDSHFGQQG